MEGPRDREEAGVWLDGLTEPFIALAMDGRDTFAGGPIDVRLGLEGVSIDFRVVEEGVPALVELFDEADDPSCLVGDLLGDYTPISLI